MRNFNQLGNAGHVFEVTRFDRSRIAGQSNRRAACARHGMRLKPQLFNLLAHPRHIFGGGMRAHYD
jgi:hypothetical protein